jgi:hypothetical protein
VRSNIVIRGFVSENKSESDEEVIRTIREWFFVSLRRKIIVRSIISCRKCDSYKSL